MTPKTCLNCLFFMYMNFEDEKKTSKFKVNVENNALSQYNLHGKYTHSQYNLYGKFINLIDPS